MEALLVVVAGYVVQVHLQSTVLAIVDSQTVLRQHYERLVSFNVLYVDWRSHECVFLFDCRLVKLRETLLVQDHPSYLNLLLSQQLLGSILNLIVERIVEGNMLGQDGKFALRKDEDAGNLLLLPRVAGLEGLEALLLLVVPDLDGVHGVDRRNEDARAHEPCSNDWR